MSDLFSSLLTFTIIKTILSTWNGITFGLVLNIYKQTTSRVFTVGTNQ